MKLETRHSYEKRIKELKAELAEAQTKLYNYRTTALEIFDGIVSVESPNVNANWVLKRLRRCFQ